MTWSETHRATTAGTSAAGTASSAQPGELLQVDAVFVLMHDTPPQQRRQGTRVGQVGADVDAEQDGQHRARARVGAASGSSTRTAGRLLIRLARTAASAAMPSRAAGPEPSGQEPAERVGQPVVDHRADDDAEREHERQERGRRGPHHVGRGWCGGAPGRGPPAPGRPPSRPRRGRRRAPRRRRTRPGCSRRSRARTAAARAARRPAPASAPAARSRAKKRRNTRYSAPIATSQGSAISAANRVKLSPLALNASRLVRLETGSSSDAVFDRCVHA